MLSVHSRTRRDKNGLMWIRHRRKAMFPSEDEFQGVAVTAEETLCPSQEGNITPNGSR